MADAETPTPPSPPEPPADGDARVVPPPKGDRGAGGSPTPGDDPGALASPPELPPDLELAMPDDLEVRHCYRHHDRETGVSCANCGRPICYECMIPAAVGFRCPECMKEQQAGSAGSTRPRVITRDQMRSRWATGGRAVVGAPVTRALLAANVVVFALDFLLEALGSPLPRYGTLTGFGALVPALVVLNDEYWRLFTAMFLHAGVFHLLFNMWALYIAGGYLERVVGSVRFTLLYFLSGFAGSALVLVASPPGTATVGASGAIFGLFGALFAYSYMNRGRDLMAQQLVRSLGFIIVLNLVITFTIPNISWQGHVGGLVGGAALIAALMRFGERGLRGPRGPREIWVFAIAAAVLIGLVVVGVTTVPV
jgi:membrane associated rhomboid family serine protease